jgi:membrane protease YdiL (CAAX protease family)
MMKKISQDVRSSSAYHWLKNHKIWLAPILPYLAVWVGLFYFKDAWFTLIGFHIAIVFVLLFLQPKPSISILFKSKYPKWIVISLLFCAASGIGLYFLWEVFRVVIDLPAQLESIGLNSLSWPMFIAYFSLVNPFVEEFFWRGFLGNDSKKLLVSDLIFAGYHTIILWGRVQPFSILFAVIILTSAGWLWRQIARENEGLLAPIAGHMLADFSILVTIYLKTR